MKNRILIHEDKGLFETIKKDLHSFYPLLVNIQKAYEGLEMGSFNSEVMEVLKTKGANPIEVDFYENIASQLDSSGITSKTIRQNLINGNTPLLIEFKTAFQDAKKFNIHQPTVLSQRPTLTFELISFNDKDNTFQINEKAQNEILETYCRNYIESESEKTVYDSLQNFVKAQNEVFNSLQNVGYTFQRKGFEIQEVMEVFLNTGSEISIKPDSIKYAVNQKSIMERRNNLKNRLTANG